MTTQERIEKAAEEFLKENNFERFYQLALSRKYIDSDSFISFKAGVAFGQKLEQERSARLVEALEKISMFGTSEPNIQAKMALEALEEYEGDKDE